MKQGKHIKHKRARDPRTSVVFVKEKVHLFSFQGLCWQLSLMPTSPKQTILGRPRVNLMSCQEHGLCFGFGL